MARNYNSIYKKLVTEEDDLIGLIAYALYKQHKIEFIELYKKEHDGAEPSDEDMRSFAISSCTESLLVSYRDEAQLLLEKLTLAAAREEISEFEEKMLRDYKSVVSSAVKENSPGWFMSICVSVIGALVFSVLIWLFTSLGQSIEKDKVELITNTINSVRPIQSEKTALPDTLFLEELDK